MWKGKINDEKEFVLLGKTIEKDYKKIKDEVKNSHSYECPCILKISIHVNKDYGKWLLGEIKK